VSGSAIVVPSVLVALLRYVFDGRPEAFDRVGPGLVGLFPLISMFLVGSITVLRERTTGTLERLLTMPLGKLDILLGYGIAFAGFAAVVSVVAFGLLGLDVQASAWGGGRARRRQRAARHGARAARLRVRRERVPGSPVHARVRAAAATAGGLIVRREQMACALDVLAGALPLTYAYDSLQRLAVDGTLGARGTLDVIVLAGAIVLALGLGAATLRRRTP
jgi:ABC-2 type transport system permease protein